MTFLLIIFVSLPLFFPHFGYHFLHFNFRQIWGLTFHLDVATCVIFCSILQFIFIVLRLYQLILLLSMEMSFIKLHLFLIPSFPNISQYDLTIPAEQKQNIRNSIWLSKLRVTWSGFSPVWQTKCFLRSEWERRKLAPLCVENWKWWNCDAPVYNNCWHSSYFIYNLLF